jgi:hypothetical protein
MTIHPRDDAATGPLLSSMAGVLTAVSGTRLCMSVGDAVPSSCDGWFVSARGHSADSLTDR